MADYDALGGQQKRSGLNKAVTCCLITSLVAALVLASVAVGYAVHYKHITDDVVTGNYIATAKSTSSSAFCTTEGYATWGGSVAPSSSTQDFAHYAVVNIMRVMDQVSISVTFRPLDEENDSDAGNTPQPFWSHPDVPQTLGVWLNASCIPPVANASGPLPYPSLEISGSWPIEIPNHPPTFDDDALSLSGAPFAYEYVTDGDTDSVLFVSYINLLLSYQTDPALWSAPDYCVSSCPVSPFPFPSPSPTPSM